MELRAFAERILHGTTLADKCAPLGRPTDAEPGAPIRSPHHPGRPPALAFVARHDGPAAPMRPALLDTAHGRGSVLHAFANHELLALELMALALLRWPDADPAFRRGLARTMEDEQRHLVLYMERMATAGVAVGEVPVSRFFWDTLAGAPDLPRLVAGLSLVLEQANLDFSQHWRTAFRAAGDAETAEVLDAVYRDEVRHVRQGWRWYSRWRPATFHGWADDLVFPLTPARARGPVFDAEGRRRAGLPEAFVAGVEVAAHSRGRPPRVLWFRPDVESDLAQPGATPSAAVRELTADLAWVMALDAGDDDVVLAPSTPSVPLRQRWRRAGLPVPRFVATAVPTPGDFGGRPLGRLEPWGWSDSIRHDLGALTPLAPPVPEPAPHLSSKAWWTERREAMLADVAHVLPAAACGGRLLDARGPFPAGPWVAKAAFSASGQSRVRGAGPPTPPQQAWLVRTLARQPIVLEPWWGRTADLSVQGRVCDGQVRIDGITRFSTDPGGRYRGTWLGVWNRGLPAPLARFVHATDAALRLTTIATRVGDTLRDAGHEGPFGIDAMLVDDDGPALHALVEVNPRWTMGRVGWAVSRRIRHGTPGWLWLLPLRAIGDLSASTWTDALAAVHPTERARGLLTQAALPWAEPARARRVLPLILVGDVSRAWAGAADHLGLPPDHPVRRAGPSAPRDA
ncbi:MAG: uncharacterized ferritin-like protein (DUF455 family) [Myxococcota bacterium]